MTPTGDPRTVKRDPGGAKRWLWDLLKTAIFLSVFEVLEAWVLPGAIIWAHMDAIWAPMELMGAHMVLIWLPVGYLARWLAGWPEGSQGF